MSDVTLDDILKNPEAFVDPNDPETKALAQFETLAEVLAYTYARRGERILRGLMDLFLSSSDPLYRETIEETADEIKQAGMVRCAKIVRSYAKQAKPDMRHYVCPYPPDDHPSAARYTCNAGTFSRRYAQHWLQTQKYRYGSAFDESKVVYTYPEDKA
jgi:hypothetical protein